MFDRERILKISIYAVLALSCSIAVIQSFIYTIREGIIIASVATALFLVITLTRKIIPLEARIYIFSIGLFTITFVCGVILNAVNEFFAMYAACNIISGVFFKPRVIVTQGIIITLTVVAAILGFGLGVGEEFVLMPFINKMMSLVVSIVFVFILAKTGENFLKDVVSKSETEGLLVEVNEQMAKNEAIMENQTIIFNEMRQFVSNIKSSSDGISSQATAVVEAMREAKEQVVKNCESMKHGGNEMSKMLQAMNTAAKSSEQTHTIIKDISDVARRTNILALNASVEAVRAGEAGRSFSVVAEEVRNLAVKSTDSSNSNAKLMDAVILSVMQGVDTAETAANIFEESLNFEIKNQNIIETVLDMAESQMKNVIQITNEIDRILEVVNTNA